MRTKHPLPPSTSPFTHVPFAQEDLLRLSSRDREPPTATAVPEASIGPALRPALPHAAPSFAADAGACPASPPPAARPSPHVHDPHVQAARVRGLDVGVGASCIYPLLGAALNGWAFVGTDVTDEALAWARYNVRLRSVGEGR